MKIAMIGHKRIPSREGGIEIVVEELAVRMAQDGHKVDVYNRNGHHVSGKSYDNMEEKKIKEYKSVNIITIPTFQNGKLNAIIYSFLATIRAVFGHYDVIHYHAEGPCSMIWLPKLFGIKTVATIHGLDWQRSKWGGFATKVLLFGEKMAAKKADEIIVLSKNVQQYFKDTYNRKTRFIPNGVEKPEKKAPEIIKSKYGLQKNDYILFLARIVPEKGLHYLLDAYKKIDTDKKLIIAGGSSHTDDYYDNLKKKASEDSRVIMTGFIQGQELEELYSNAYVYVLPSDIEGMPLSLLEAMSYGNCCLVSDINENTEVITDYGVKFKKSDVNDLVEKLSDLLNNEEHVRTLQEKASDYVCNRYDWNKITEKTLQLYRGNS